MQEMTRMQTLLLETVEVQKKQLTQSTRLLALQERENAQLRQQRTQEFAVLQQIAQRLEDGGERFGQEALRTIGAQTQQVMTEQGSAALSKLNRQAEQAAERAEWAGRSFGQQQMQLTRTQTALLWKTWIGLAVGAVFLVGGTGYVAWKNKQAADRYDVDAVTARAITEADVILCGDRLCANVEAESKAVGDKGQYRPIKPRGGK